MTEQTPDAHKRLDAALAGVDLAAPSTTKFSRLENFIAGLANLPARQVVASTVSKAGNFVVRVRQSARAEAAQLFVGVVPAPDELEGTKRSATAHVAAGGVPAVLLLTRASSGSWEAPWGVQVRMDAASPLDAIAPSLGTVTTTVEAPSGATEDAARRPLITGLPATVPAGPVILPSRVRRMLLTAVASRPAVMLVGPPGTGKSQLVAELFADVAADPNIVGMVNAHEPFTTTPDESWTVRELVGGETVDDLGRLRFSPGVVLESITQDRWLVLDEANRADMDRIFGGLLTWLSGQPVTIGRVSGEPGAGPVRLAWSNTPECKVAGLEALQADTPGGDPVDFLAGTEWRLLGTYNALDAQRVFRFGLALGRRFAHVPVPAPGAADFATALSPRLTTIPEGRQTELKDRIVRMYQAHLSVDAAALGPAVFLDIPGYVGVGLDSAGEMDELLAEAYLTSTGTWLARLEEDQLDRLGTTLASEGALGGEWEWVRSQLDGLR